MSSLAGRGCGDVGDETAVDGVGDAAFEAAECFSAGFSFVLFALVVVAAGVVGSGLGDGDDVEGSVESSIAAAVEAMALCSAR
jgi:hypothetical protein